MCSLRSLERWRAVLWLALLAACGTTAPAATLPTNAGSVDDGNTLAGWVYIDRNNDGQLAFNDQPDCEWVIPAAEVSLYQVSGGDETLLATAQTNAEGRYVFNGLDAGLYTLRQTQPEGYVDGIDTLGEIRARSGELITTAVLAGQVDDDAFLEIQLTGGVVGDGYNFGELGMLPEYVSKRYLLGTASPMPTAQRIPEPAAVVLALLAAGGLFSRRRR